VHQNKSFAVCAKAGSSSRGILLAFAIRFLQSITRPVSAPLPSHSNTFTDLVALTQAEESTNGFPIMRVPFNSFFSSYFPYRQEYMNTEMLLTKVSLGLNEVLLKSHLKENGLNSSC